MTARAHIRRALSFLLLFALLFSLNLFGAAPTAFADESGTCGKDGDNLTWTFRDGTLTISGEGEMADYNDDDTPAPWSELSIDSLCISEGVTSIGDYAFSSCYVLTGIDLPDSLTFIGDYAFYYCVSLTYIILPDSIHLLGSNPFSGCFSLAEISVSPEHPSLAVIDGVLYSKADQRLVCCLGREKVRVAIPEEILCIDDYAFFNCSSLTDVVIPESVTSIGNDAFYGCENLAVIIPKNVTSIGDEAFGACSSLTDISIPDGVTSIGDDVFCGCENLTNITIPESVTSIGDEAFFRCRSLKEIKLPNNITSIGDYAFGECENLTSITIPRQRYLHWELCLWRMQQSDRNHHSRRRHLHR